MSMGGFVGMVGENASVRQSGGKYWPNAKTGPVDDPAHELLKSETSGPTVPILPAAKSVLHCLHGSTNREALSSANTTVSDIFTV